MSLIDGPWRSLAPPEARMFRVRLADHLRDATSVGWLRDFKLFDIVACPVSFYEAFALVSARAVGPGGVGGWIDTLVGPGCFVCLDGTSAILHRLNGVVPDTADAKETSHLGDLTDPARGKSYLQFFTGAVRGQLGGFRIVERGVDLVRLGARRLPASVSAALRPASVRRVSGDGGDPLGLHATAIVYYGGSLFETEFAVHRSGRVDMLNDRSIAQDIGPPELHCGVLRNIGRVDHVGA